MRDFLVIESNRKVAGLRLINSVVLVGGGGAGGLGNSRRELVNRGSTHSVWRGAYGNEV